jgi:hypothetical protein
MNLKDLVKNINLEEESLIKKEVIKTIIVINLLRKNKSNHKWINIHNNFIFFRDKRCDLYFENIKNKEVKLFKIIRKKSEEKRKEIEEELEKLEFEFFNSKIIHVLDVDDFSDDIFEINNKIIELI